MQSVWKRVFDNLICYFASQEILRILRNPEARDVIDKGRPTCRSPWPDQSSPRSPIVFRVDIFNITLFYTHRFFKWAHFLRFPQKSRNPPVPCTNYMSSPSKYSS